MISQPVLATVFGNVSTRIPVACRCGEQLLFSTNLHDLFCSNPECWVAMGKRLHNLLLNINIDSLSLKECEMLCRELNFTSEIDIVDADSEQFSKELSSVQDNFADISLSATELAALLGIPELSQDVCETLFGEFDRLDEAVEEMLQEGVTWLTSRLAITEDKALPFAVHLFDEIAKRRNLAGTLQEVFGLGF
jgi:NAD-dependent DNA ligase